MPLKCQQRGGNYRSKKPNWSNGYYPPKRPVSMYSEKTFSSDLMSSEPIRFCHTLTMSGLITVNHNTAGSLPCPRKAFIIRP